MACNDISICLSYIKDSLWMMQLYIALQDALNKNIEYL